MIARVLKLEIVAKKEDFWPVLEGVKRSGTVHLEPLEDQSRALGLSPEEAKEEQGLRAALSSLLGVAGEVEDVPPGEADSRQVIRRAEEIRSRVERARRERDDLEAQLGLFRDYRRAVAAAVRMAPKGGNYVIITLARAELRHLEIVKTWLEEKGLEPGVEVAEMGGGRLAVVIPAGDKPAELREFLWKEGFNELKLPEEFAGLSPDEAARKIEERVGSLPRRIEEARRALSELLRELSPEISALVSRARDRLASLRVKREMAETGRFTFALRGWVLEEDLPKLQKELLDLRVSLKAWKPDKKEFHLVPVKLENPGFIRPFESLIGIYQLPMYGTCDPTWTLWFFFPIYFGFMLGDVGYGILALVLFGFMRALSKPRTLLRDFSNLFLWAGFWTLVFGVAYGEFFGTLGEALGMKPLLMHRLHDITSLLLAAIGFGVLQVLLGIFIGFINNLRLGHAKHAVYELARFFGIAGILMAVAGAAGVLPGIFTWTGIGLAVGSVPVVSWVEGFVAPLEMLSAVGNMMSFARLMAIGLASAILAMIANIFYSKVPLLIGGIVVALLFHALNTVLGIFDPTVQGLRLQFVEFFSKFYITGTKPFKPLKIGGKDYVS